MCYSIQPRDQIFAKGYGFSPFAKNMSKNTGKNISKNLSGKYSQKPPGHTKKSATDDNKFINKQVQLFSTSNDVSKKCWKKKIISASQQCCRMAV